jgi:hypothetical protein
MVEVAPVAARRGAAKIVAAMRRVRRLAAATAAMWITSP